MKVKVLVSHIDSGRNKGQISIFNQWHYHIYTVAKHTRVIRVVLVIYTIRRKREKPYAAIAADKIGMLIVRRTIFRCVVDMLLLL